ncbi:colicin E3/pyocin S6 family cytotoxin [Klebsiella pneumoniae]|uniref:colicin E3/pyocin S6 family cytotoxin n=1 Tax=Klebsiella pneumoniae TaxID=573 RepID=UPI002A0A9E8F|nr:colicin E3/pyocin S6 family cytotoxin [Klebsiella pneumoniae]
MYEWDSQHGELEGYRASDRQHLGAFDPKTGESRLKGRIQNGTLKISLRSKYGA